MKRDRVHVQAPALVLAGIAFTAPALAGPPFRTDDPVPVTYRQGEAYAFSSGTHDVDGWSGVGPAIELIRYPAPDAVASGDAHGL